MRLRVYESRWPIDRNAACTLAASGRLLLKKTTRCHGEPTVIETDYQLWGLPYGDDIVEPARAMKVETWLCLGLI